jgi:hypothetical protein
VRILAFFDEENKKSPIAGRLFVREDIKDILRNLAALFLSRLLLLCCLLFLSHICATLRVAI